MENLGEKIKRLRSEKGFSQANLHQNQSAVAQIENGYNSKPKKQTLIQIAKNLEIPLEELVKDTDWENTKVNQGDEADVYSQLTFSLTLDEDGTITVTPFPYPAVDANGNENKYCPETGAPLVNGCPNCQRPFTTYNIHCMGCGKEIFQDYIRQLGNYLKGKESAFEVLRKNKNRINEIISELTWKKIFGPFYSRGDNSVNPDQLRWQMAIGEYDEDDQVKHVNTYMCEDESGRFQINNINEYLDGLQSSNPDVVSFVTEKIFEARYYSALIKELKKYRDAIPDSDDLNTDGSEEEE